MLQSSEGRPPARRALPLRVMRRRQFIDFHFSIQHELNPVAYSHIETKNLPAGTIRFIFKRK
jgi:hypothetical protein